VILNIGIGGLFFLYPHISLHGLFTFLRLAVCTFFVLTFSGFLNAGVVPAAGLNWTCTIHTLID